ncbi:MAG: superoxide dismutase [Verrucomicrobiaceae bacterium]|nr:superoxide dismutase [Verrucomicrobiaceae bacterium]
MNRRSFITTTGTAAFGSLITAQPARAEIALPALPYTPAALEPHIDAETMAIHHGKHHAAYIAKLNDALKALNQPDADPLDLITKIPSLATDQQMAVRNHGGGHVNHSWFWNWMAPAGRGPSGPDGKLAAKIQSAFGSIDDFKKTFNDAATKRFGSGWAWLIVKSDGTLTVTSTANQDNPLMKGVVPDSDLGTPVLGLDVWEHAYYLKYRNKRPDYISAWWNVVNWAEVNKLAAAAGI